MATTPFRPVVLRNGTSIEDPLRVVLDSLWAWDLDVGDPSDRSSFGEPDLRHANRGGARVSAAEIAAILERRPAIERALGTIAPDASLAGAANSVPWLTVAAALRLVRRHPRGRLLEDDEGAAPKAPGADSHARQRRPAVPGGRF